MLYLKALHLIAIVFWFSGLFYLPRLFVYHTMQHSNLMQQRFIGLECQLYYYITTPGMVLTLVSGVILLLHKFPHLPYPGWLIAKIIGVLWLSGFHIYLGYLRRCFAIGMNKHSEIFFRYLNEVPTLFLLLIVLLAVFHPHL